MPTQLGKSITVENSISLTVWLVDFVYNLSVDHSTYRGRTGLIVDGSQLVSSNFITRTIAANRDSGSVQRIFSFLLNVSYWEGVRTTDS